MQKFKSLLLLLGKFRLLLLILLSALTQPVADLLVEFLATKANVRFDIHPLLLFALIVVLSAVPIISERSSKTAEQPSRRSLLGLPSGIRRKLLANVKSEVESRLKSSLHNAVFVNLLKEEQPKQVKQPWTVEVKVGKHSSVQLPVKTSIIEVFDRQEIAGKLLILGAPGAGKTTTLVELARNLIARAENNVKEPMPILCSLSSWAEKKQAIAEWLGAEVKSKYGVHEDVSQQLLENRQLLPLLDGLDELIPEHQERCIQAINQFQQDYHPKHLIVCCRLTEYQNANTRLQLSGAICLQLLTEDQIHEYLVSVNQPSLWSSIQKDPDLLTLAKSPLMLSILSLAYEEISLQEWQAFNSTQERRQYLFNTYIQYMLARELNHRSYAKGKPTPEQTQHWLIWLAKVLQKQATTEFSIEKIQPYWLQSTTQKRLYRLVVDLIGGLIGGFVVALLVGPLVGLVGGFIGGLIVWLVSDLSEALGEQMNEEPHQGLTAGLVVGFISGLIYGLGVGLIGGLVGGLIVVFTNGFTGGLIDGLVGGLEVGFTGGLLGGLIGGLLGGLRSALGPVETLKQSEIEAWSRLAVGLRNMLVIGLIFGLIFGPWQGLSEGLREGLLGGLVGGLIVEMRQAARLVETVQWSVTKAWSGLTIGLCNGLAIGLIGGLVGQLSEGLREGLIFGLVFGLIFGLIGALTGGLISGFSGPDIKRRTIPNQGIWQSAINAGVFALISGLASGLIGGLMSGLTIGLDEGFQSALTVGLKSALIVGLTGGLIGGLVSGTGCLKHFTLRIILYWSGSMPWNYARFLNYATERLFLQQIGGRYQFIHQLLQDHFAQMR